MGLLAEFASYLESRGCGVVSTDIFAGNVLPEGNGVPATAIFVSNMPGFKSYRAMGASGTPAACEQPVVEIIVRAPTFALSEAKMAQVFAVVDFEGQRIIGGTRYLHITTFGPATYEGEDEKKHKLHKVRVKCMKERSV